MDTVNLQTFLLLSKLKNFTQTARQLFVAQSTVTCRIAELEQETGVQLFTRNNRNVTLTEEGRRFADYARRMVELEEACIKSLGQTQGVRQLRIGAANAVYESALKERVLKSIAQGAQYRVVLGHSAELLQMLGDRLLDAVYAYQSYHKSGYRCTPFFKDDLVLVVRSDCNDFPRGIRREDLERIPCAMCNFALQDVGAYLKELFPERASFPLEIDNSSKVVDYIAAGLGYSFLPRGLVAGQLKEGVFAEIAPLDFKRLSIQSYRVCLIGEEALFSGLEG